MSPKEQYLRDLERALPHSFSKHEILKEYEAHIEEKQADYPERTIEEILDAMGDPVEIAQQFEIGQPAQKSFVSKNFVFCNFMFFFIGGLLTFCYHLYEGSLFSEAWGILARVPLTIVVVYTLFWMLLGFEIGREYGALGKKIFSRTFFMCLLPNVLLMFMTLFELIPVQWFQPFLTPAFIYICVVMTFLLYPISKLFYYLGMYRSV
ncbi:HAAS signaling domain-containing protein [Metabacillus sp. HB246100]